VIKEKNDVKELVPDKKSLSHEAYKKNA